MKLQVVTTAALAAMLSTAALAQGAATVQVGESEEYGTYLTDGDGRPLYLFTTDKPEGAEQAQITCTSDDCLAAWPLFTTTGDPQAGENVDAGMLGTMMYENQTVVTYNDWPLYYFVKDESAAADEPQGQDIESFGGEWYLVQPSGEPVHEEGEE